MVMIKTRSLFGFIVVIAIVGAATALSIDTAMNVYAQNTTMPPITAQQNQTSDPQQIKNYLTQAIQALDSGNNTKAAEQIDLAEDQLEDMIGTESAEDDEDEEIEEGAGEDADEPGDIETNDEQDTP
jgi:thiamine pyrophosphate-dependent acetolactate synthase large subunit-like protein